MKEWIRHIAVLDSPDGEYPFMVLFRSRDRSAMVEISHVSMCRLLHYQLRFPIDQFYVRWLTLTHYRCCIVQFRDTNQRATFLDRMRISEHEVAVQLRNLDTNPVLLPATKLKDFIVRCSSSIRELLSDAKSRMTDCIHARYVLISFLMERPLSAALESTCFITLVRRSGSMERGSALFVEVIGSTIVALRNLLNTALLPMNSLEEQNQLWHLN